MVTIGNQLGDDAIVVQHSSDCARVAVVQRPTATPTWIVVPTPTVVVETSPGLSPRWVEMGVVAVLLVLAMGGGLWIGRVLTRRR